MSVGRVALVTGAARGLGRGVAARLVRDGWSVTLLDLGDVGATAHELDPAGSSTLAVEADVSDADACVAAVDATVAKFGTLRALVNNAGIGGPSTAVHLTDPAEYRRVLEVNLVGPFLMARAAVPALERYGAGAAIVNVTSVLGQRGEIGTGAYSASKGGLGLLGQSMALELAPSGIRVNSVAPGNMLTEMHREHVQSLADREGISYDESLAQVRATVPLGRHGTPEDIGDVVAWLLSDDASYVTGQTVAVNGGILLT